MLELFLLQEEEVWETEKVEEDDSDDHNDDSDGDGDDDTAWLKNVLVTD